MKKYFKSLNWKIYNLPQNLKERGIDDVDKLPNFHFREDGLKMWAAVEEFVQTILAIYYNSDDDIQKVVISKLYFLAVIMVYHPFPLIHPPPLTRYLQSGAAYHVLNLIGSVFA